MSAITPLPVADGPLTDAEVADLLALHERASAHGFTAKKRDAAIETLRAFETINQHVEVTRTRLIAQIDEARRGHKGRTTSSIITDIRKIPTKIADGVVKKARRLTRYPALLDAHAAGTISLPNVATACQTLEDIRPFIDDEKLAAATRLLIADAEFTMPSAFKRRCRVFKDEIDLQGARTRAQQDHTARKVSEARRYLVFKGDSINGYDIRGHLPGRHAAAVFRWLSRESNALYRRARARGGPMPGEAARDLDALVSLALKAEKLSKADEMPTSPRPSSADEPANADDARSSRTPPRTDTSHTSPTLFEADAPQSATPGNSQPARPTRSEPAQPTSSDPAPSQREHARSEPRLMGPELREILTKRDGGCVVPWCNTAPEKCDGHHLIRWADGGPTSADNMCLMCPRHHPEFENPPDATDGWRIQLIDGIAAAIPPIGVDPQRRPRYHARFRQKIPSLADPPHAASPPSGAASPPPRSGSPPERS